jgi:hypothetical protein
VTCGKGHRPPVEGASPLVADQMAAAVPVLPDTPSGQVVMDNPETGGTFFNAVIGTLAGTIIRDHYFGQIGLDLSRFDVCSARARTGRPTVGGPGIPSTAD